MSQSCPFCTSESCCMAKPVCLRLKRDVVDTTIRAAKDRLDNAVGALKHARPHALTDSAYMVVLVDHVTVKAELLRKALEVKGRLDALEAKRILCQCGALRAPRAEFCGPDGTTWAGGETDVWFCSPECSPSEAKSA